MSVFQQTNDSVSRTEVCRDLGRSRRSRLQSVRHEHGRAMNSESDGASPGLGTRGNIQPRGKASEPQTPCGWLATATSLTGSRSCCVGTSAAPGAHKDKDKEGQARSPHAHHARSPATTPGLLLRAHAAAFQSSSPPQTSLTWPRGEARVAGWGWCPVTWAPAKAASAWEGGGGRAQGRTGCHDSSRGRKAPGAQGMKLLLADPRAVRNEHVWL